MGVITIRCPRTGAHVPVGQEITTEAFKSLKPRVARMRCPACGKEHAWSKGIAWLSPAAASPMALPPASRLDEKLPSPGIPAHIVPVEADRRSTVSRLLATWRIGPARKREAADGVVMQGNSDGGTPRDGGGLPPAGPVEG